MALAMVTLLGCSTDEEPSRGEGGAPTKPVAVSPGDGSTSPGPGPATTKKVRVKGCPTNGIEGSAPLDLSGTTITDRVFTADDYPGQAPVCVLFRRATLRNVTFDGSKGELGGTLDFRNAELVNVTFRDAIMTGSDFRGAKMIDVDFIDSGLRSAIFGRNSVTRVTFTRVTCPWGRPSEDNGGTCLGGIKFN